MEAVNIKKKSIAFVVLLTLALILCIGSAAAATTTPKNTTSTYKAAGSTSTTTTTTSISVTISQLDQAAGSVKVFIDKNKRLPNYVTISGKHVTMPQFLYLLSYGVNNLNSKKTSSISVKTVNYPISPSQTVKSGTLTKTSYIIVARNLKYYVDINKRLPNYANTSLGRMRYESLIYTYSKIIVFYGDYKRLPNTVSVKPWTGTTEGGSSTNMAQYLQSTTNAPSTNATIKNLAATITAGKTTTYAKAQAIFNWVRNNLTYSYYYNTKKGALGALSSRTANCCDTSHLLIALTRASGIPARYVHGDCQFSDGWYGHVCAQMYVGGKWYFADAISDYNTLGTIKNWNTSTFKLKGIYAVLPF